MGNQNIQSPDPDRFSNRIVQLLDKPCADPCYGVWAIRDVILGLAEADQKKVKPPEPEPEGKLQFSLYSPTISEDP